MSTSIGQGRSFGVVRSRLGEQGWCSGESTRLPPMLPGLDSLRHIWVEFVVGSHPCSERFFFGYSGFPFSSKTSISKSNSMGNL